MRIPLFWLVKAALCSTFFVCATEASATNLQHQESNEKRLFVFKDAFYYFRHGALHKIPEIQIANTMLQNEKQNLTELDNKTYAHMALGEDYSYEDYAADKREKDSIISLCQQYESHVVSCDDTVYYYIEHCKKRKLLHYNMSQGLYAHIKTATVVAIPPDVLDTLPLGKPLKVDPKKDPVRLSESARKDMLPKKDILCKNTNGSVVSFYESFFYVEKCSLRRIVDFNVELQRRLDAAGRDITDLSLEQALGLEEGVPIDSQTVLNRIHIP